MRITVFFLFIVSITFLCFLPDLHNGLLIWDDEGFVTENTHIRSLNFETVKWAFSSFYVNYWAPLTWLSLAVDYAFWGLNPVGYHLTNNIFHALNAGIFFLLSYMLINIYISARGHEKDMSSVLTPHTALYCSLLAALLFALHPLRVESVAWVTERKDVLSMFFGLLAVIFYIKHAQTVTFRSVFSFAGSRYYWLTIAFYSLYLLSKTMFITLPFVLLVLDWFPLRRFVSRDLRTLLFEKAPLLALAFVDAALVSMSNMPVIMMNAHVSVASRVLVAIKSTMYYFWLMVWPSDISPFYLHPGNIAEIGIEYVLPILLFVLVTSCCVFLAKRQKVFLAVWLLYLITLTPFMGFLHAGPQSMAARFTYLPGLPVALLYALGTTAAFVRLSNSRIASTSIIVATVLILVSLGSITVKHISFWKDDVTLFSRVIDLRPHQIGRAYYQRSLGYTKRGEFQNAQADMDEAIKIALSRNYSLHSNFMEDARLPVTPDRIRSEDALNMNPKDIKLTTIPEDYHMWGDIAFSEDGGQVFYKARKRSKEFVVVASGGGEDRGPSYKGVTYLQRSPDGWRFAFGGEKGEKKYLVVDNKVLKDVHYDEVAPFRFSPDSRLVACQVEDKETKGWFVLVSDGEKEVYRSQSFPETFLRTYFTQDNRLLVYELGEAKKRVIFFLDLSSRKIIKEERLCPDCRSRQMAFNSDSSRVIYVIKKEDENKNTLVLHDFALDKERRVELPYTDVGLIVLSPDGERILYTVLKEDKHFIVESLWESPAKREESGLYEGVSPPDFLGPDARATYFKMEDGKWSIVIGDKEGPGYAVVGRENPVVSPDGSKIAYSAGKGGQMGERGIIGAKWFAVVSPVGNPEAVREGPPAYDILVTPVWSPDGKYIVYRAREGTMENARRFIVVVDPETGEVIKEGPVLDEVWPPVWSPDGKEIAYGARVGRELWWNVETIE